MATKSIYLIDISAYVFRAYYAVRPLTTSKGVPTNATYGVITMVNKLIRDKKPDGLVVVFDSPKPSFRKEIYPEYKANREIPPDDLPVQFDHVREFIETYPLGWVQQDGYEADDLIASLTSQFRKNPESDTELVIVSGDKDLMQLVGDNVVMYDPMKDKRITAKEVEEKFSVGPDKVLDLLSLAGDSSDNIPGVPGVGAKTAAKLLNEWGSLEAIFQNASQIKGKLGEKLGSHQKEALLSKELVTLKQDIDLGKLDKLVKIDAPNQEALNTFYHSLELHSLASDEAGATQSSKQKVKYELVLDQKALNKWVNKLKKADGFSFDTETTDLDPMRAHLVGLSFAVKDCEACYIPVGHSYLGCPEQLGQQEVLDALRPLLEDQQVQKFSQNGKYDMEVLFRQGITVKGLVADSMIASYLIDPTASHGMDALALQHLNHQTKKFKDYVGKNQTFADVDVKDALDYAAEDADITHRLVGLLHQKLEQENLVEIYNEIEIPLIDVLFRMETHGVFVDKKFLQSLSTEFNTRLSDLKQKIYQESGREFNIASPKQLAEVLFNHLGLPPQKKTKTGYSTDVAVLTALSDQHPMPAYLLQHRTLSKLVSTYVDQLQQLIHPDTGRIHTNYSQTIAATGRLSSSDPNLQNIPIRTEEGRRIREAFSAAKGWKILSADYSQIELRVLASLSQDPHLIKAYENDEDVHRMTAEKVFGKKPEQITPDLRAQAKTVNFGILYGQSPFGLAKQLGISQGEAKAYIEGFFKEYPAVFKYREQVLEQARSDGLVTTWKGRRRLVPDINSKNKMVVQNAERVAFNTVFQGSAADLIKVAMINIDHKLRENNFKTKMIMQVHDELIFEVLDEEKDKVSQLIQTEMENAIECQVPLKVDIGVGQHWGEAH